MSAREATPELAVQATCLRWLGRGLLLRGEPGTGKSDLALRLLEAGAFLVADDLVRLERRGDLLIARALAPEGLIEARGQGLFRLPLWPAQPLHLLVDCSRAPGERLPEPALETVLGVALPRIALVCCAASAVARIRLALYGHLSTR
ncbi:MAG: hypothetical protein N2038_07980 [Geminicoccaceae bacterium]|nr:hypothetical protein [Geminicoccaceae bacterium]